MQVHSENGRWLIGRNFVNKDCGGINGGRSQSASRVRLVYDSWTGERWSHQRAFALWFDTQGEAEEYLAVNWNRLAGLE